MRKLLFGVILALTAQCTFAQSAIVRGEVSAGSYENIKTDAAQALKVSISGTSTTPQATFTNTTGTVTNATTQLIAANAVRKYISVQNNDGAGIIYLNNGAGAATTANGVKILPGQMWVPTVIPVGAIQAIGSIASNANVIVVEGN